MKNTPKNPRIATDTGRKAKKGSTTPKTKKKPVQPRFYEVKIRITLEEYVRGLPFFDRRKHLEKFVLDAYREKVKRSEAHDKEARQRALVGNADLLLPVLKELHCRGQLDFISGGDCGSGSEELQGNGRG